jgi:hypothetical protein
LALRVKGQRESVLGSWALPSRELRIALTSPVLGQLEDIESTFFDGQETTLLIVQDHWEVLIVHLKGR